MSKYHISEATGGPARCVAQVRVCPVGGEHFDTLEEARAALEAQMGNGLASVKKTAKPDVKEAEKLITEYRSLLADRTEESYARISELQKLIPEVLPDPPTAEEMMESIETPRGFKRIEGQVNIGWGNQANYVPQLVLEGDGVKIEINFSDVRKEAYILADGHVSFKTDKGWRTFDQRGIDDSFYIDNPGKNFSLESPTRNVNETIRDFIERKVPESRARIAGSEVVPGLGGRLATPEQKKELLEKGGVSLFPSGFGIGYHFTTKPNDGLGMKSASQEQKNFFGVKDLWVFEFDCD